MLTNPGDNSQSADISQCPLRLNRTCGRQEYIGYTHVDVGNCRRTTGSAYAVWTVGASCTERTKSWSTRLRSRRICSVGHVVRPPAAHPAALTFERADIDMSIMLLILSTFTGLPTPGSRGSLEVKP
jgi:hypothetical protein